MLSCVVGVLIGLVFLVSGGPTSLGSAQSLRQVRRFRLLPWTWERPGTLVVIASECALGLALVTQLSPWLYPLTAGVLVVFLGLTAWGVSSRRIEDCGCYGGLLMVTPAQSM